MRKFWCGVIAVALVWGLFHRHPTQPDDPIDNLIVSGIALIFALASVVMIAGTSRWSARALGLLLTSMGTAVLYGAAMYSRNVSHKPSPEWVVDLSRSLYVVGGPLLVYGLVVWMHNYWGPPSWHDANGLGERRQFYRRKEDRELRGLE
ncbi:MAG: hypothetical protein IT477_10190 [Rhodanobacteraceae bacterium]|nr:hypothetical protein [Rhodanobacteraceae bacterium]